VNEYVRAVVIGLTLLAVIYLAVVLRSEAAGGALLGLLGLAGSFLFRGRVETPGDK
jgi:hypothetical protein